MKDNILCSYLSKNYIGNHAITLVNSYDKTYLCDSSSLDFLSLGKNNKGKYIFRDIKTTILPEFIGLLENKMKELNRLLMLTTKLNLNEIINLYEKLIYRCELNKDTFDKFHESIKTDIDIVSKTLK